MSDLKNTQEATETLAAKQAQNSIPSRKSLRERASELSAAQLPIMVDRKKGETEELIGQIVTIKDFGFLTGKKGEYAVFIVKEEPETFYFGGMVVTDALKQLEADGYHPAVLEEGLPVVFSQKKSQNNQKYTAVLFYPEG